MENFTERLHDRVQAGRLLAKKLMQHANRDDVMVLGLPRGGIPVAYQISKALHAPLDAFLVRKLGTPGQEELAMGAIAMGGIRIFNPEVVDSLHISKKEIEAVSAQEEAELERRNKTYREGKPVPNVKNRIVILVDDGLATGATMRAAIDALKQQQPKKIIVAVPVAPRDTYEKFKKLVDEIICLQLPAPFYSIGQWYENFPQTSDEEVLELLRENDRKNT